MDVGLLAKYQTGIVGLLGFGGVIVTLFVNAYIARRQVRDHRGHERETLARALLAELRDYHRAFSGGMPIPQEDGPTEGELLVPAVGATPVFDANIARLGLLRGEQVEPVLRAYICIREFDRALVLFSEPHQSGLFREVAAHRSTALSRLSESIVPQLEAAITALDSPRR